MLSLICNQLADNWYGELRIVFSEKFWGVGVTVMYKKKHHNDIPSNVILWASTDSYACHTFNYTVIEMKRKLPASNKKHIVCSTSISNLGIRWLAFSGQSDPVHISNVDCLCRYKTQHHDRFSDHMPLSYSITTWSVKSRPTPAYTMR